MKATKNILIICALFFSISSKAQNTEIEEALEECVDKKINEYIENAYGEGSFDFYKFILVIEQEFLFNHLIRDTYKESYLNLLNKINQVAKIKYSKMYNSQNKIIDEFGFEFNSFAINEIVFNQCPYKVSLNSKDNEGKLIYSQGMLLNELMKNGFDNEDLIKELISVTDDDDFDKIVYRAPIILLVMINLDNKYNKDLKKLKKRQKGKVFLNKN